MSIQVGQLYYCTFLLYPTINGRMQNRNSVGVYTYYTLHTRFCTLGADLYAQSVLGNKISVSELSRNFIESALLAV